MKKIIEKIDGLLKEARKEKRKSRGSNYDFYDGQVDALGQLKDFIEELPPEPKKKVKIGMPKWAKPGFWPGVILGVLAAEVIKNWLIWFYQMG